MATTELNPEWNQKPFICIRSIRNNDKSLIDKLHMVYILERDLVNQIEGWETAYLWFAEWHKN